MADLIGEIYDRKVTTTTLQDALTTNVVVSHSGRTLAEILSLSHPEDLSRYTIDGIVPGYGREGTLVRYSRPESELLELQGMQTILQTRVEKLEKNGDELKKEVNRLKKTMTTNTEVLAEWQVASLVKCAFGSYAWNFVSNVDRTELALFGIHAFWEFYHARFRPGRARNVATRIYRNFDVTIREYADRLKWMKGNVSDDRQDLAHPNIPDNRLLEFLTRLGYDEEGLQPCEVALFEFLKSKSNKAENIALAARDVIRP